MKNHMTSSSIETVKTVQIGNVDVYEIIRFKENEELSENHSLKFIKLCTDKVPGKEAFEQIFDDFPKPKIIIFINGESMKTDYPPNKYKKKFKETLSKFLIADTQWVIGTGVKIRKEDNIDFHGLISDAVQDCRFDNFGKQINMIGMLDYAFVKDNQSVIKPKSKSSNTTNSQAPDYHLDPHYNCLILHEFTDSNPMKKVLEMQIKFQEYCEKFEAFTIQILCGGKLHELRWTLESLKKKIFILVLKGSGGIADVICDLINESNNIDENIQRYLGKITNKKMNDYKLKLTEIQNLNTQILVYNIMDENERIDRKLFEAIITSMGENLERILLLSMSFSETFIKKREILQKSDINKLNDQQKRNILKAILKNNKPILLELFLKKSITIDKFLDVADLKDLYKESIDTQIGCKKLLYEQFRSINKIPTSTTSKDIVDSRNPKNKFNLTFGIEREKTNLDIEANQINEAKKNIVKSGANKKKTVKFEDNKLTSKEGYQPIPLENINPVESPLQNLVDNGNNINPVESPLENLVDNGDNINPVESPLVNLVDNGDNINPVEFQHLFIWALLSGLHEIAKILWREGFDHVATALKGSIILEKMSQLVIDLSQLSKTYLKESEWYKNMAIGIMTEAFDKNQWNAHFILLRPIKRWNNMSCLQIAVNGDVKAFCNINACLSYTNCAWYGDYSLQVSTRNKFQNNYNEKMPFCKWLREKITKVYQPPNIKNINEKQPFCKQLKEKITKSPILKFINYIIFYLIFLLFFVHVNLVELKPFASYDRKINLWSEIYVYCYVAGFIFEEINQIINQEPNDNKSRFCVYLKGSWNLYDCVLIVIFTISVILRFALPDTSFDIIRCLYALALSMFCIRSMQFFFIFRTLGPKVIMIKKMIIDIIFFLLIFIIFMVSYGTLSQSLQHPNSPLKLSLIDDILYRPYFHVYGELMLDDHKTACNTTNCFVVEKTRIIAFGIFLILTTILLVNLLIAMFGHTFTLIQEEVENHFSILQLQLLQEFYNKVFLPPPFNIIIYIVMIFSKAINRNENKQSSQIILVDNSRCDSIRLAAFEKSLVKPILKKLEPK